MKRTLTVTLLALVSLCGSASVAQSHAPTPVPPALETFLRAQLRACDDFRTTQGGSTDRLFTPATTIQLVGTMRGGVFRVHLGDSPGWTVDVDLRRQRIRNTRGASRPLPTPLDFCPGPVWEGPMHD
ncbi:MAG: hypothetical protein WCJ30_10095 [Deltaproteobacteria bacterium]